MHLIRVRKSLALLLFALLIIFVVAACDTSETLPPDDNGSTRGDEAFVSLEEVPLDLHRRAAQLLVEVKGGPLAPNWNDSARLRETATLFYRPDLEEPAYVEFPVEPAGFIIVSTGRHDYPVTHWNDEGPAPSDELFELGRENAGEPPATFYKLDTLSYAAESAEGELIAAPRDQSILVEGLEPSMLDDPEISEVSVIPVNSEDVSDEEGGFEYEVVETGPQESNVAFVDTEGDWERYKDAYAESFGVYLEALARDAREDWAIVDLTNEFGEGLFPGESFSVAPLFANYEVDVSGAGAEFVTIERNEESSVVSLIVAEEVPEDETLFKLSLAYENGAEEAIIFFIAVGDGERLSVEGLDTQSSWGPRRYWWVGSSSDQRVYYQYTDDDDCLAGCGPVAWAMLYGWADALAENGDPRWGARCGLYDSDPRNNGCGTAAPRNQTPGVEQMIAEIANHTGTICFGSRGTAVVPWNMWKARRYYSGQSGTRTSTHFSHVGIPKSRYRNYALNHIKDGISPVILGTGYLRHYPLAWGYAYRSRTVRRGIWPVRWTDTEYNRSFYVNQGWGGHGDGWINARTWFSGRIFPN